MLLLGSAALQSETERQGRHRLGLLWALFLVVPVSGLSGLLVAIVMVFCLEDGYLTQVCPLRGFLGKLHWKLLVGAVNTWTGELWEARVFCSMGQKSRWSWSSKRQIRTKHMCRCREEERQHRVSCRCFRLGCNTCLAWLDSHPWVLWGVLNPYHKCQLFSHHPPQMGFWPPTYFNLLFLCHLRSQQGWMWKHIPWSL